MRKGSGSIFEKKELQKDAIGMIIIQYINMIVVNIHNSKKGYTNTVSRWLFSFILTVCCTLAASAQDIEINETNFPDANFRAWLKNSSNIGGRGADGILTQAELNAITQLEINNRGIKDITGIEHFTKINMLRLTRDSDSNKNIIPTVDLSNNNLLERLYCTYCGIENLTLPTERTKLRQLYAKGNKFEELDLSNLTALTTSELSFNCSTLKKLDVSGCKNTNFTTLNASESANLETIIAQDCTKLRSLSYNKSSLKYLDLTGCTSFTSVDFSGQSKENYGPLETLILKDCANLGTIDCYNNSLTTLDVTGCVKLVNLNCNFNLLPQLVLKDNTLLKNLQCADNLLEDIDLDPAIHTHLSTLVANRAGRSVHHSLVYFPTLDNIQVNGGPYLRKINGQNVEMNDHNDPKRDHISMDLDAIDHLDLYGATLRKLLCRHENLSVLDLSYNNNLEQLELRNNRLLTLDLSVLNKSLSDCNVGRQYSVEDLVVFDRNEVGILLPNATNPTDADVSRFTVDDFSAIGSSALKDTKVVGGKYYLIISKDATTDLDLYEKEIKYTYDTRFRFTPVLMKDMDVTINCNTYIMYISPNSRTDVPSTFYSGTICLPYESIVPEGVKAYVISDLKDVEEITIDADGNAYTANQLITPLYAGPDETYKVLPANTPVYVTAELPGLYAFQKNYDRDYHGWRYDPSYPGSASNDKVKLHYTEDNRIKNEVPAAPAVNLLTGTQTDTTVSNHGVLTLGREKGHSHVGFWMFTGTTIPAHRAYINVNTSAWRDKIKKGGTLNLITNFNNALKQ